MHAYKGKKLIPKPAIKELLESRIETSLQEYLNKSTWDIHEENQYPAPLPLQLQNPPPELLAIRLNTLLTPINKTCPLCGSNTPSYVTHALLECQHALSLALRQQMWQEYQAADSALGDFIKSSSPKAATRVMTGLQLLSSPEANALMLKVAVLTLCKNYAEQLQA